jgi:hypothetical protein
MEKMNKLLQHSKLFVKRNASTILTCAGGAGVVATAVMAVKATPKAMTLLEEAKKEKGEELTKMEMVKVAGPSYIPAVITGVSTIACIFGANILNKRQQAALMSAYALLDSTYKDYQKKVEELYGEDANDNIKAEIAKDKYVDEEVELQDDNNQLFYDEYSGRYFESTTEDVIKAEYNLNRKLADWYGVYLNEFYEMLGLEPVDYGDHLGWNSAEVYDTQWSNWIDFNHKKVTMDDGLECYILSWSIDPTFGFEDY